MEGHNLTCEKLTTGGSGRGRNSKRCVSAIVKSSVRRRPRGLAVCVFAGLALLESGEIGLQGIGVRVVRLYLNNRIGDRTCKKDE